MGRDNYVYQNWFNEERSFGGHDGFRDDDYRRNDRDDYHNDRDRFHNDRDHWHHDRDHCRFDDEKHFKEGKCRDDDCKNNEIKNKCFVEVCLCGKDICVKSNEVEARVANIKVKLFESCRFAIEGERLDYLAIVKNEGFCDLHNIEWSDRLDNQLEFDRDSFKVNGKRERADVDGRTIKFKIRELKENCEAVIVFSTKVKKKHFD